MILVYGASLFGKVDEVPGMFHVETKFAHVYYAPLIPIRSYVVLGKQGKQFRGVPIGMSAKSILAAWGRLIGGLAAVVGGIGALADLSTFHAGLWPVLSGAAAAGAVAFALLSWHKGVTRANFDRACALGRQVGLTEQGMAEVCRIYGRLGDRGFDVLPTAPGEPAGVQKERVPT